MRTIDMIMIGAKKPPHVIARWIWRQLKARRTAKTLPNWQRWLGPSSMAAALDADDFESLAQALDNANPFPGLAKTKNLRQKLNIDTVIAVNEAADRALRLEVDILGSGPTYLGKNIDWALDFKSNTRWPMTASRRLPVNEPDQPSDIKVPWELSRLQWLLPVGQRYVLEGKEADAVFARTIIEDWIVKNPIYAGPNWMCAMDVALRAISMVWLFHACKKSKAWRDIGFRENLIKSLIIHGRFIEGNLEYADVNGNHLTANLAGLTIIGIALGGQGIAAKWVTKSWHLLLEELPLQVPEDGVCREGSAPYHRLVAELFCLPALARMNVGLDVNTSYLDHLSKMAAFVDAATGTDGTVPVWGDADDGRALMFGNQQINDHRYLSEILKHLKIAPIKPMHAETVWWLGTGSAKASAQQSASMAFIDAGVYVLRNDKNIVFVDAGPVGMAGRGGHGHNDCLAIDASLDGVRLLVDPGSYVYTADADARNRFRRTAAHNTPQIDGQEINRFFRPEYLWLLKNDAKPRVRHWKTTAQTDTLIASHSGYQRLADAVTPTRSILLEKQMGHLLILDEFEGNGDHHIRIPFTFAPGVEIEQIKDREWYILAQGKKFRVIVDAKDWKLNEFNAEYSSSYGIKVATAGLELVRHGSLKSAGIGLLPYELDKEKAYSWIESKKLRLSQLLERDTQ